MCTTNEFMGRLEAIIIEAELYEELKLDVPCSAVQMLDLIGSTLLDNIRQQTGWTHIKTATQLVKQRDKILTKNGIAPRGPSALTALMEVLEAITEKQDAKNGAADAPKDEPNTKVEIERDGQTEVHVFAMDIGPDGEMPSMAEVLERVAADMKAKGKDFTPTPETQKGSDEQA